jgi:hypothetical protein
MEISMGFLKTKNRTTKIDCTILLLDINPKECKSIYNRDTYTPIFIEALFIIAKLWNQPKCTTTNAKCLKKMWYIYTWSI